MKTGDKNQIKQYRYPGAQPFSKDQKDIFFGREQDIDSLYQLVSVEQLIVLYSKSGLGKSSLLNAGVIPKIENEGLYDSISFRFGAYTDDKIETPATTSQQIVGKGQSKNSFLEKVVQDKNSLWYQLKNRKLQSPDKKGFLLIFDQFEELFTYPDEAVNAFKMELVEILNSAIPQKVRKYIEQQFAKDSNFLSDEEMEFLHDSISIKIIMAIRSDRMSHVAQLADYLPDILSNCYELGALTTEQAEDAILNPAYLKSSKFITHPFDYTDETIEAVLDFLTKESQDKIESFQLQILCQTLEQKVHKEKIKLIKRDDLGDIESVYKNYYDNQINDLGTEEEILAARKLIEDGLIFEDEERRLNMYEGQVFKVFNISPALLAKLVDSHLLRAEPSMKGGYTYELSHDTLVAPVLRSKRKRKKEEARLIAEKNRLEKEAEMEELREEAAQERKRRNQATMAAVTGFLLFGLAMAASVFAYSSYVKATKAETIALQKEEEARQSLLMLRQEQEQKSAAQYDAFMANGKTFMAQSNFIAAAREFSSALGFRPDDSEALKLKKESESKSDVKGQFDKLIKKGEEYYSRGSSYYVNALETFREAKTLGYNNNLADSKINTVSGKLETAFNKFVNNGDKFYKAKGYQYALENYQKALRIKPNDSSLKNKIQDCKSKL
ncbi:MAG: hypothetical protein AB8F74_10855 [Saprospiraceae bacterium]